MYQYACILYRRRYAAGRHHYVSHRMLYGRIEKTALIRIQKKSDKKTGTVKIKFSDAYEFCCDEDGLELHRIYCFFLTSITSYNMCYRM